MWSHWCKVTTIQFACSCNSQRGVAGAGDTNVTPLFPVLLVAQGVSIEWKRMLWRLKGMGGCWNVPGWRSIGYRGWVPSLGWVKHGMKDIKLFKAYVRFDLDVHLELRYVWRSIILEKCSKAIGQFTAFELVCLPVRFSYMSYMYCLHARQICLDSSQYGQTRRYKTNSVSPRLQAAGGLTGSHHSLWMMSHRRGRNSSFNSTPSNSCWSGTREKIGQLM